MSVLPYLLAVWIFLIGLYGIVSSRNLIHVVVCVSVCQSSTYVLLLAVAIKAFERHGSLDPAQITDLSG